MRPTIVPDPDPNANFSTLFPPGNRLAAGTQTRLRATSIGAWPRRTRQDRDASDDFRRTLEAARGLLTGSLLRKIPWQIERLLRNPSNRKPRRLAARPELKREANGMKRLVNILYYGFLAAIRISKQTFRVLNAYRRSGPEDMRRRVGESWGASGPDQSVSDI